MLVPVSFLLAGEQISTHGKDDQACMRSVFIHAHAPSNKVRVVGLAPDKVFISSFAPPETPPHWLAEGVLLDNDLLKKQVAMIRNFADDAMVKVTYARGAASAVLSDGGGNVTFKVPVAMAEFPDYDGVIKAKSGNLYNADGSLNIREWEPVGFNSAYLKQCGEVAKTLDAGVAKDLRSKSGMMIHAYGGQAGVPLFIEFTSVPGTIMVILPRALALKVPHTATAQLLAPAIKASVAALRAHSTRWLQVADNAGSEIEREAAIAKSRQFLDRVGALLAKAPGVPSIAEPEPEAEPEFVADPDPDFAGEDKPQDAAPEPEPEAQPEAEPEDEPETEHDGHQTGRVTRVKIKLAA
jgi:hypothetical protein